ncbi:MAG: DUF2723 domain-containing protein [Anaerolineae bacterium]|nr:DUF2723 domain-containing protein [Anaerolineae bacterium]
MASAFVSLILLGLYLTMAPSQLTWSNFGSDAGDYLAAVLTQGIPHPSGYPTYIILGGLFQKIPLGTPYFRGALLSIIPAALACGLLSFLVNSMLPPLSTKRVFPGVLAGLWLGTTSLYWSQAVIVEVHALNALFVVLSLFWVYALGAPHSSFSQPGYLIALAALVGLGVGNHLILLLGAPVWLLALGWFARRPEGLKPAVWQLAALFFGLLVYLILPLRARHFPAINWGNPQNLEGFLWQVAAQPYQGLAFHTPQAVVWERLSSWVIALAAEVGYIGVALGILGLFAAFSKSRPIGWFSLFFGGIYSIFALGYYSNDSQVYLIPLYLLVAIWLAFGLDAISRRISKAGGAGMILLVIALLIYKGIATYPQVDPRRDLRAARFVEEYLDRIPPNALVITDADQDTFALWYYHFGLSARPDIILVVSKLADFEWYRQTLTHIYPHLSYPPDSPQYEKSGVWLADFLVFNPAKPVCRSTLDQESEQIVNTHCSFSR